MLLNAFFFFTGGLLRGVFLFLFNNINIVVVNSLPMKGTFSKSISLTMETWGRLEAYASRHGLTMSKAIDRSLGLGLEYLERVDYGDPVSMEKIFNAKKED